MRETTSTVISNSDCSAVYGIYVTGNTICSSGAGNRGICSVSLTIYFPLKISHNLPIDLIRVTWVVQCRTREPTEHLFRLESHPSIQPMDVKWALRLDLLAFVITYSGYLKELEFPFLIRLFLSTNQLFF